jgi:hypothetical protein
LSFREAFLALEQEEAAEFSQADIDRFEAFLNAIWPALIRTGTGGDFHLTQLALEMEQHGHRFASCLHSLASEYPFARDAWLRKGVAQ